MCVYVSDTLSLTTGPFSCACAGTMESRRHLAVGPSCLILVLVVVLTTFQFSRANINRKIGVQFLSFSYVSGQLPDGSCCDAKTQAGGVCAADACDTAFVFCVTHQSNGSTCDPFFETTPLMNNNSVSQFGKHIDPDVANSTTSLIVLPVNTMEPIRVGLGVKEVDENGTLPATAIGNFTLLLNTTNLFTKNPDWITHDFANLVVKLSLNATSFCSPHYFGASCDIYCNDRRQHYTCDQNGSKICHTGYEGVDCKDIIDLCVSHPCHHGASCQKKLNDFTCTCAAGYTGKTCDSVVPTSAPITPSGLSQSSHSPTPTTTTTTTTPTPTPTTFGPAVANTSLKVTSVTGQFTASSAQQSNPDPTSGGTNIGVILGPLAGLLLLAALAALLILWFQRKRERTVKPEEEDEEKKPPEDDADDAMDTQISEKPQSQSVAPLSTQSSTKTLETAIAM